MDLEPTTNKRQADVETETHIINDVEVPCWFSQKVMGNLMDERRMKKMIDEVEKMDLSSLESYVGGEIIKLPYEVLKILLPRGSNDSSVGRILGEMRSDYLKKHPEKAKVTQLPYYIDPHGVIFPDDHKFSPAELRTVAVGNTCIHYEAGVPGMDDTDVREK